MAQTYASYTYTPNGQVATLKDAKNNLTSYQYDGHERKVTTLYPSKTAVNTSSSTDTEQYAFDNNANLISFTKRSGQVINFAYDNLNRLLTRSYTTSAENVNFSYDSDNRLKTAASTDLATAVTANLTYDAQGRLRQTQISVGGVNKQSQLLYDGVDLVAEYDTTTQALQRRYVHGPGVDEPLVWYEGAGTTAKSWLYADHLGSIIATANASGASSTINTYGPFGESAQTTPDNNRFGYTGQQQLKGLGLNYYKARVYSPALGRFLQVDPIGVADDLNLYGYVGNGPINLNDPSGLVAGWLTGTALAGGNAVDNLLFGGYAQNTSQAFGAGNIGEGLLNFGAGLALGAMNLVTGGQGTLISGGAKSMVAGQGGRFGSFVSKVGDDLTAHHIPQAALNFTSKADGGAVVMTTAEHAATRTYFSKGRITAMEDAATSFRDVLA